MRERACRSAHTRWAAGAATGHCKMMLVTCSPSTCLRGLPRLSSSPAPRRRTPARPRSLSTHRDRCSSPGGDARDRVDVPGARATRSPDRTEWGEGRPRPRSRERRGAGTPTLAGARRPADARSRDPAPRPAARRYWSLVRAVATPAPAVIAGRERRRLPTRSHPRPTRSVSRLVRRPSDGCVTPPNGGAASAARPRTLDCVAAAEARVGARGRGRDGPRRTSEPCGTGTKRRTRRYPTEDVRRPAPRAARRAAHAARGPGRRASGTSGRRERLVPADARPDRPPERHRPQRPRRPHDGTSILVPMPALRGAARVAAWATRFRNGDAESPSAGKLRPRGRQNFISSRPAELLVMAGVVGAVAIVHHPVISDASGASATRSTSRPRGP